MYNEMLNAVPTNSVIPIEPPIGSPRWSWKQIINTSCFDLFIGSDGWNTQTCCKRNNMWKENNRNNSPQSGNASNPSKTQVHNYTKYRQYGGCEYSCKSTKLFGLFAHRLIKNFVTRVCVFQWTNLNKSCYYTYKTGWTLLNLSSIITHDA